jgi:anthranilate synthase component I
MIDKKTYINFGNEGFSIIPLVREVQAPGDTPISLYLKIADQQNTFLLESVEGGDKWAQYSIIGFDCIDSIKISGNTVEKCVGGQKAIFDCHDPLNIIQEIIDQHSVPDIAGLPRFYGGYVGFFAYESAQYAETKIANLPGKESKFKEHMPDILLVKAEKLIVFDNLNQTTQMIFNANPENLLYEDAQNELDAIEKLIMQEINVPVDNFAKSPSQMEFNSNFLKTEFLDAVNLAKNYIQEGDVMQVVLAQDFSMRFEGDSFALYRAIRQLNPSPYMYFLNFEECTVVGASPEILVRLEENEVTLRPLAGTRKRGDTPEEDEMNAKNLLADPKEIAEHLMLIDLGRNDVGRVSKIGTVAVTQKMAIEKYSHVMHIVSNVTGTIADDLSFIDVLKAALPAGTLSGAPKIRAMEIINELEPSSRGIYGGAIGYISWTGSIDTAIAIRTAVIKDHVIHVGAGAGIVADSIPENEWLECQQKLKVFIDAIEMIS